MSKKNKWVKFDEPEFEDDKDLYKKEQFTIPQMQKKSKNVRTEKEKTFRPSEFVSPIRGRNVKDVKDSEFINGFGNVGERYKNMKAASGNESLDDVSDFDDVTFKNNRQNANQEVTRKPVQKYEDDKVFYKEEYRETPRKPVQKYEDDRVFYKEEYRETPRRQVFKEDMEVKQTPIYEEQFTVSSERNVLNQENKLENNKDSSEQSHESKIHKRYNNTVNDDTMVFNTEYMVNQLNRNKNRKMQLEQAEEEIFIDETEEEYDADNSFETVKSYEAGKSYDPGRTYETGKSTRTTKSHENDELTKFGETEEFEDFFSDGLSIQTREADERLIGTPANFKKFNFKKVKEEKNLNNNNEGIVKTKPQIVERKQVIEKPREVDAPVRKDDFKDNKDVIDSHTPIYFGDYQLPPVSLLKKSDIDLECIPEWVLEQSQMLDETFTQFNIDAKVERFRKGPTVTRYEVKLAAGINVKKIMGIKDNIKMNMAAKDIRIEAPIPGKPNVGIEVPNVESTIVPFGNIADTQQFRNTTALSIGLGLSIDGTNIYTDIAKMPHGLIAGATGSGKSVCINTLLISLLMKNSPEQLRLMLIDPKVVELIAYNDLPHLITPVINDPKVAAGGLTWAVDEMERRYKLFAQSRVRDIGGYNKKNLDSPMAYIVIVIDELADLMMVASNEVEDSIQRLTQKSRACGIHLIVATQRPTTDVVKGTIKSNIPSRIAFRVASFTDSVTILDSQGAESLLGMGDMLVSDGGVEKVRVQGAYISDAEIDAVTDFIRDQRDPAYVFEHDELLKTSSVDGFSQVDELVQEVAYYVVENKTASINKIQKEFNIGFNRAQKIVDSLESLNIVSENVGTKPREVLVDITELNIILGNL